jgi:hypothetical protein
MPLAIEARAFYDLLGHFYQVEAERSVNWTKLLEIARMLDKTYPVIRVRQQDAIRWSGQMECSVDSNVNLAPERQELGLGELICRAEVYEYFCRAEMPEGSTATRETSFRVEVWRKIEGVDVHYLFFTLKEVVIEQPENNLCITIWTGENLVSVNRRQILQFSQQH